MIDFRNLTKWLSRTPRDIPPVTKNCAACGAPLSCGATGSSCWCQEIATTAQVRAGLAAKYQGCLCRVCLTRAAKS